MQYRKLGRTDIEVSAIAMGCWAIVGDATWGPQDEADTVRAIETCLDVGINFFDTAESYGDGYSEDILGRVLAGRRDEVVIASKVNPGHLAGEKLRECCEASLRRLGTDYLDLYQVHWPNWDIAIDGVLRTLEDLRAGGKIRAAGVSSFGPRDLAEVLGAGRIESNQMAYSMLWRGLEVDVQPTCVEHGLSVLPYCPLAQGLLTGKFGSADDVPEGRARTRLFADSRPQAAHGEPGAEAEVFEALATVRAVSEEVGAPMADVALAWLLAQPAVTSVLAGARNGDQIRMNARAADLVLPPEALARLSAATDPLKAHFAGALDFWRPEGRIR